MYHKPKASYPSHHSHSSSSAMRPSEIQETHIGLHTSPANTDYLPTNGVSQYMEQENPSLSYDYKPLYNNVQPLSQCIQPNQALEDNPEEIYQQTDVVQNPFIEDYQNVNTPNPELVQTLADQHTSSFTQEHPRANELQSYAENSPNLMLDREYNQQKIVQEKRWNYAKECLANSTGVYTQVGLGNLPQNKVPEPLPGPAHRAEPVGFKNTCWDPRPYNEGIYQCGNQASLATSQLLPPPQVYKTSYVKHQPFANLNFSQTSVAHNGRISATGSISSIDSMRNEGETPSLADLEGETETIVVCQKTPGDCSDDDHGDLDEDDEDDGSQDSSDVDSHDATSEEEEEEDVAEDEQEKEQKVAKKKSNALLTKSCEASKLVMPFKKRKRMRQLRYPKTRFINCRKILIFDLTLEEEFRIHNIDFQRNLAFKEYIKLMKTNVPNFEQFKIQVYLSAFGQNRVVIDPQQWESVTIASQQNFSKSVEIFEEIAALPGHIWNAIKTENTKTWSTFTWALCWAHVDSGNLVQQESKAGLWDQELQVRLISNIIVAHLFH